MALKIRRSLAEPVHFVWEEDPALDRDHPQIAEKWAEYLQSGDVAVLEPCVREGMRLALFTVKPLSRQAWLTMQSEPTGLEMAVQCVAYGLKAVQNVEIDGLKFELGKADFMADGREQRLKPETLDQLWDPGLFSAMGKFITDRSRLDPSRGQG